MKITPNEREFEKRRHPTGREPTSSPGRFSLRVRAGGWVAVRTPDRRLDVGLIVPIILYNPALFGKMTCIYESLT